MTLREFVERGAVGTWRERRAFETGLVEAHQRACDGGLPPPGTWAIDADIDPALWELSFGFAKGMLQSLGAPLGHREST